jgi:hypothetical protein
MSHAGWGWLACRDGGVAPWTPAPRRLALAAWSEGVRAPAAGSARVPASQPATSTSRTCSLEKFGAGRLAGHCFDCEGATGFKSELNLHDSRRSRMMNEPRRPGGGNCRTPERFRGRNRNATPCGGSLPVSLTPRFLR